MLKNLKSITVLVLVLILGVVCLSAQQWEVVKSAKWQAKFNDVFFLDNSTQVGWIVGSHSTILHTKDGGKNWERQPNVPFPSSFDKIELNKIRFISSTMGWVCGDNGTVLKTIDGGKTWDKLNTSTNTVLGAITFADENNGWAGGDGGYVTHTSDGGRSWKAQDTKTNNVIMGISFKSPTVGWAVGGGGTVLGTVDGGQTWKSQKSGTASTLDALFMLTDQVGWASGGNGALIHTTDGGKTWESQESKVPNTNGMPEPIWGIHFADEKHGYGAAEFGVILATVDGGKTWTTRPQVERPVQKKLNSVHLVSPKEAWIVGDFSTVLHTTDGGKNWEVVSSNSDLTRVSFYENQGWAIGLAGAVMHSSDGGKTWKDQISGNAFELFGVGFTSEQKGYIVGSNATLLETKSGGSKWHMVNDPRDEGHGTATRIVFDDPMTSWKSALGFYNLHFPTSTHGWGVGEMGKIAVTTDGGENWYGQSTNNPGAIIRNLHAVRSRTQSRNVENSVVLNGQFVFRHDNASCCIQNLD